MHPCMIRSSLFFFVLFFPLFDAIGIGTQSAGWEVCFPSYWDSTESPRRPAVSLFLLRHSRRISWHSLIPSYALWGVQLKMKGVLQIKGASGREKKAPKELESVLNQYFGYSGFRGKQLEAIEAVLSGLLTYCACVSLYLYWLALVLLRCFQPCWFCLIC